MIRLNVVSLFIHQVDDMALRDAASLALSQMAPVFGSWLVTNEAAYKTFVSEALMGEIKRGLHSKTEVC